MQKHSFVRPFLKVVILCICLLALGTSLSVARNTGSAEQQIVALSKGKWQWMADKNVDKLFALFDDQAKFVYMSGNWKKDEELEIVKTGSIWYEKTDIHDVAVEIIDNNAIIWSSMTLSALVRGTEAPDSALSSKEQSIIQISALTALGKIPALKIELNKGLDAGLTINEIKETLIHTYAYCGFPRSIRGLQTFMQVVEERKSKGIDDNIGREASPITGDSSKYDRGKRILEDLTKTPQPSQPAGYSAFAPAIDTFLKEHLFADIFERDVLTYAQRELITISVISAIGDADPMLKSHLNISLNMGWSAAQLKEFVRVITPTIGKEKALAAKSVLNELLGIKNFR